jgi:hypothetical protein
MKGKRAEEMKEKLRKNERLTLKQGKFAVPGTSLNNLITRQMNQHAQNTWRY